ncbi:DegT/DnrJ/EryC1/StrS family aminotransferase [Kitasatospora sp. NPDC053057]|uniref:DegT/DnrJ/EryC1/StrS family aminotransferase n=1 Tax=Kitasatospora sp. NPDC053057 TaxID=3364062 RepID=UPI0037CA1455
MNSIIPPYTWPHIDDSLRSAVDRQLGVSLSDRDGRGVIGGFEAEFAQFVGSRYAIAFSSGTAALHAMCVAAGLGPDDEIIAPAYTFFATATPFAYEGVKVVFADADGFGNLDPADLPNCLTEHTKAVIVTHMWGNPCDMTAISTFCRENGLMLLEDCSHAHFASWAGQRVGTFGAMAVFSTNQKPITTGEGGVLVTDDDRLRELALLHGHYNKRCFQEIDQSAPHYQYALTGMGLKSRASTLGAAIGLDQLGKAELIESRRREVLAAYIEALDGNPVVSPALVDPERGQSGLYVVGLRYHQEAATETLHEFVQRLDRQRADFDVPGSTNVIANEPLFHRSSRQQPWTSVPEVRPATYPGAEAFIRSFFKTPLWGYPGDEAAVAHHVAALVNTTKLVAR